MRKDDYPRVICQDCAHSIGRKMPEGHIATFYPITCDICGRYTICTEPRDYGHFSELDVSKMRDKVDGS